MPKTATKPKTETASGQPDTNGHADETPQQELLKIVFNGDTYTVPKDRDEWSVESELTLYEARATNLSYWWARWVEIALGPEQWERLLSHTLKNRGDLKAFIQTFAASVAAETDD